MSAELDSQRETEEDCGAVGGKSEDVEMHISGPEIDRHTDAAAVSIIHTPPLLSCLGIVANTQEVCTLEPGPGGRPPCAPFDSAREHRSACIRSRCQSHHLVSCNNRRHESF